MFTRCWKSLPQRERSACAKLFQALQNAGDFDMEEECSLTRTWILQYIFFITVWNPIGLPHLLHYTSSVETCFSSVRVTFFLCVKMSPQSWTWKRGLESEEKVRTIINYRIIISSDFIWVMYNRALIPHEGLPCCGLQVTAATRAHSSPFQVVFEHWSRSGSSPWQWTAFQWSLAVAGRNRGTARARPEILERDQWPTFCQSSHFSLLAVTLHPLNQHICVFTVSGVSTFTPNGFQ